MFFVQLEDNTEKEILYVGGKSIDSMAVTSCIEMYKDRRDGSNLKF